MQPRIPRPLVLLLVALALAGCGRSGFRPFTLVAPPRPTYPVAISAVVAPDSIAAGQPFVLKVSFHLGCWMGPDLEWTARGDSILVDAMQLQEPIVGACPDTWGGSEGHCLVTPPHAGRWTLAVRAMNLEWKPIVLALPIVVGSAPVTSRRFDVLVLDSATQAPVPAVRVSLATLPATWPPDTLANLVTDLEGRATRTLACADTDLPYAVTVNPPPYWSRFDTYYWSPPRCGVPERAIYLVDSSSTTPSLARRSLAIHYR